VLINRKRDFDLKLRVSGLKLEDADVLSAIKNPLPAEFYRKAGFPESAETLTAL
jgi:hypothetical protein